MTVMEILGHSQITTTMRYAHAIPNKKVEAMEMLAHWSIRQRSEQNVDQEERIDFEAFPQVIEKCGEPCRNRTCDPLVKSQMLYQLS